MKHTFLLVLIMISFFTGNSQSSKTGLFDPSTVKIAEIKTNTIRSDFGPAVIGDSIYYSSFRDEVIGKPDKKLKNSEFYDLYKAGIDDSGNVVGVRHQVDEFITRYHDGPVSWCAQTGELFVTQSNYTDPAIQFKPFKIEDIKLRIILARKKMDKWTVVEEFPYNNAQYSVGHPAINESGDTLFFASDMPGGFGETDLYYSVRKNEKWSTPVNLGSQVNTSGKEEFPFITGNSFSERCLIFASTGHQSKGGMDLFFKRLNDPDGEVFQFQEPINSVNDDFAMNLPENVKFGYLTSNRPGTGNDDIYKFTFNKYLEYLQEILVLDAKTRNPIPGAQVNFCDKKNGKTGSDGITSFSFEKNSVCNISASALGYKENSKLIKIGMPRKGTVLKDTIMLEMIVNEKIILSNIYYDFDKWNILPESAMELDRLISLLSNNPDMKVELSSHTDERGTEKYNLKLSQLRAQSAVDYMISKGIDHARITGKGYGKSQLIHKSTGIQKCTPVQHRENRRTELYIPRFLRSEPVKQIKGDFSKAEPDSISGYSSYQDRGAEFGSAGNVDIHKADRRNCYLILGSFNVKLNASGLINKLKTDGIDAAILQDVVPFRVGIGYNSLSLAKDARETFRYRYPDVWILGG